MFKKILLPTDGSEHSQRATEKAIGLAELFDGEIEVVFVVDSKKSKNDVLHNVSKVEIELNRKEKLEPVLQQMTKAGIPFTTEFLNGEPGPTIVEYANKGDYDVVVLGSRGLNNLQTMVLGSVSHKVAKDVECPVMIVK